MLEVLLDLLPGPEGEDEVSAASPEWCVPFSFFSTLVRMWIRCVACEGGSVRLTGP